MSYDHLLYSQADFKLNLTTLDTYLEKRFVRYSSSDNRAPPISRVLISQHLIFCSLTSSTFCNSPRKYALVKYKTRQIAGLLKQDVENSFRKVYMGSF